MSYLVYINRQYHTVLETQTKKEPSKGVHVRMAPRLKLVLAATIATCSALQLVSLGPMSVRVPTPSARAHPAMLFERKEKQKPAKAAAADVEQMVDDLEKKDDKTKTMLQQVKDAGVAGAISYAAWELAFWGISVPVCIFTYVEVTGHLPDFSNQDDLAKLGAEAFAFVNLARFAVPLRIGLALSSTPWVQANVVDKFMNKEGGGNGKQ